MASLVIPHSLVPPEVFPRIGCHAAALADGPAPEGFLCLRQSISLTADAYADFHPVGCIVRIRDDAPETLTLGEIDRAGDPLRAAVSAVSFEILRHHGVFPVSKVEDAVWHFLDGEAPGEESFHLEAFVFSDGALLVAETIEDQVQACTDHADVAPDQLSGMVRLLLPGSTNTPSAHETLAAVQSARGLTWLFNALYSLGFGPGGEDAPLTPPTTL